MIKRIRYVIVRTKDEAVFCGLAKHYQFKIMDELGDTEIKTYMSEVKAKASFLSSRWDSKKEDFENGTYKVVKVFQIIEEDKTGEELNIEADKESENKRINNLEKAKEIIKTNYRDADCGIYDSRNIVGDEMITIYRDKDLTIDICYNYAYFEVFGLTNKEFKELEKYYNSLESEG